jgi:4-amino-4-deoxy-L-arabinose transferase-like glycosyltransferase
MQAVPTQSPAFDFLPTVAPSQTLGDLRMGQNNYATASSFSAKSMRPLLIVVILIAVGAGIAWGVNAYPKYDAAPTVPAASSQPTTANDSPVTTQLIPLTKSEVNSVPSVKPARQ